MKTTPKQEKKEDKKIEFDYDLQVWTENGVITNCGHDAMSNDCCNGRKLRGRILARVKAGIEN